jgi:ubiquinone/menaquinone biosynthesis C-methylase UbiE
MTTATLTHETEALKQKQQRMWASGDYSAVAARIVPMSERLAGVADFRAGSRVLDVAGGSGNTALAAARSGALVTSLDYVPELLLRAAERSRAEGLPIELVEGDAEDLPFDDESFDAVISVVGVMFAPNQEQAAAELVRVCRPGGTIALAAWTPDGFIGELFRVTATHVPPPAGAPSPLRWGTKAGVDRLLGRSAKSIGARLSMHTFRYESARAFVDFFRTNYGPTLKAFESLADDDARAALELDLMNLVRKWDRLGGNGGPVAVPAEYLEILATRS